MKTLSEKKNYKTNIFYNYSKACLKQPFSKRQKFVFKTNYRLMQVKSIAESFCNTFDFHEATICH